MVARTAAVIVVVILMGCTTVPEVRVEKRPEPPIIVEPTLPALTGNSEDDLRNLADYILVLRARLREAIAVLESYR
jgi:hypothetical protein